MLERALQPRRSPDPAEPAGLAWGALYPTLPATGLDQRSYDRHGTVVATTSSTVLAVANPARASLGILNASATATLYVSLGPVATTSEYLFALAPGQAMALEDPDVYQGIVAGVWSAAAGSALVTETTR